MTLGDVSGIRQAASKGQESRFAVGTTLLLFECVVNWRTGFTSTDLGHQSLWHGLLLGLPDGDAEWLMRLARAQILHNASVFHRRVVETLDKYPHRLLLLVKSNDTWFCLVRQAVAKELLEASDEQLEINARKVRKLFRQDLLNAQRTGLLTGSLRVTMRGIAWHWQADTRECERVNKMLNLFTERAPTASFELQSSRACLKHFLGEAGNPGSRSCRRKWSVFKPVARNCMELCLGSWGDRREVQNNTLRWDRPTRPQLPSTKEIDREAAKLYPRMPTVRKNWAACYNMIVNKFLANVTDPMPVLNFSERGAENSSSSASARQKPKMSFFICADKVRTTRRLVPCTVTPGGRTDGQDIEKHICYTMIVFNTKYMYLHVLYIFYCQCF